MKQAGRPLSPTDSLLEKRAGMRGGRFFPGRGMRGEKMVGESGEVKERNLF